MNNDESLSKNFETFSKESTEQYQNILEKHAIQVHDLEKSKQKLEHDIKNIQKELEKANLFRKGDYKFLIQDPGLFHSPKSLSMHHFSVFCTKPRIQGINPKNMQMLISLTPKLEKLTGEKS